MSVLTKSIGKNIRDFRKRRNLKQYELAEKIGVNCITLSKIERGSEAVKISLLEKISTELGYTLEQIVFGMDSVVLNNSIIQKLRG